MSNPEEAVAPEAPTWARRSVREDGGFTHELVSDIHPRGLGVAPCTHWMVTSETDVSISAVDQPGPEGWVRSELTVQVEGGRFTLTEARRLRQALDGLLDAAGNV